MAAEQDVGRCPETDLRIVAYNISPSSSNGLTGKHHWNLARYDASYGSYSYLTKDFTWISGHEPRLKIYDSLDEASRGLDEYFKHLEKTSIKPLLIQKSPLIFKFKCPKCSLIHISKSPMPNLDEAKQYARRWCPKTGNLNDKDILVRLWFSDTAGKTVKRPAGPEGTIPKVPIYDCKECYGTGEYTGFMQVDPCVSCFGKPKT